MKGRRSTTTLTLVLIGAAALHGCGGKDNNEQATRDVYKTRADCQRDWGDDPKKCEPQSSGRHSGYFYGPMYGYGRTGSSSSFSSGSDSATQAPRQGSNAVSSTTVSRSTGSSSVARGGFGSSASAHSSSSSS